MSAPASCDSVPPLPGPERQLSAPADVLPGHAGTCHIQVLTGRRGRVRGPRRAGRGVGLHAASGDRCRQPPEPRRGRDARDPPLRRGSGRGQRLAGERHRRRGDGRRSARDDHRCRLGMHDVRLPPRHLHDARGRSERRERHIGGRDERRADRRTDGGGARGRRRLRHAGRLGHDRLGSALGGKRERRARRPICSTVGTDATKSTTAAARRRSPPTC